MGSLPKLHPMLRAALTSGTIMAGGDLICQTIEQGGWFAADDAAPSLPFAASGAAAGGARGGEAGASGRVDGGLISTVKEHVGLGNYDLVRTSRFFGVGLTLHGPFFNKTLGVIERVVGPATCAKAAAKKVALGHVFLFPSYAFLFNVWMSGFEGKGLAGGVQKFRDTWADVFVAGTGFWPAANMINFMYCPPAHRVLFLNCGGLYWNAFLSWQNAKQNAREKRREIGEGVGAERGSVEG